MSNKSPYCRWVFFYCFFIIGTSNSLKAEILDSDRDMIFEPRKRYELIAPVDVQTGRSLEKISYGDLPTAALDGSLADFREAISRQVTRCLVQDLNQTWDFDGRTVTRREYCVETGNSFLKLIDQSKNFKDLIKKTKSDYDWYRSVGSDGQGAVKFTGYYLPLLNGREVRSPTFSHPLYGRPTDLVEANQKGVTEWKRKMPDGSFGAYFTRWMIDWEEKLLGRNIELFYTNDFIDVFFLQIQGSGIVRYPLSDGNFKKVFVNYNSQNGHPYFSIGKQLRREGVDSKYLSLQGLKKYFEENPYEIGRVLPMNKSYVFFQKESSGPYGSSGTVLVPWHSIATDRSHFAQGAIGIIQTQKPEVVDGVITEWRDFSRFVVNQDTGGAIKGAGRVDVYWGSGTYAELAAGNMIAEGGLYFALKKNSKEE